MPRGRSITSHSQRRSFAIGTAVAFLVGWNADLPGPGTGGDADVFSALYMATRQGLLFGEDISGAPLAFIKYPVVHDVLLTSISFGYAVLVQLLTAALLVWAGQRILGRWSVATLFAAVATSIHADPRLSDLGGPSPVHVLAFVACGRAMQSDSSVHLRIALAVGSGVLAGIEMLAKINVGLLVVAMVLLTLVVVDRRRVHLALFAATFVLTLAAAWFVTGQSVGNIDDYFQMTSEVATGYTLSASSGQALWDQSFLLLLVVIVPTAVLLAGAWLSARDQRVTTRIALTVLTGGFIVALLKFGFLTLGHHGFIFFTAIVGGWFAFQWGPRRRLAVLTFVVLVAAYYGGAAALPPDKDDSTLTKVIGVNPLNQRPTGLLDTRSPSAGRAAVRREVGLDARTVQLIGDRPVHAAPSVVGAYQFNWKPLPVFSSGLAVTPFLDRANARVLRAPDGPERVLRDRNTGPFLESPASQVAMLCNFRHLYDDSRWQVLGRARSRCGPRRFIRTISLQSGDRVNVPSLRNKLVLASVRGIEPSAFRIAAAPFLDNPLPRIALDGEARVLTGSTAVEGLVVGVPPQLDYPGAFRLARDAELLSVLDVGAGGSPGSLSIAFHAIPVEANPQAEAAKRRRVNRNRR